MSFFFLRFFFLLLPFLLFTILSMPVAAAPPPGQSALLNGMHDMEAMSWMQQATPDCDKGWITDLRYIGIGGTPSASCHQQATQAGISVIQRLDASGSESYPHDPAHAVGYAQAFAHYVSQCSNIHVWIVGNEPNFTVHKSDPNCSTPAYARSYVEVHKRVHALPGHENDLVLLASNSPYSPGCLESLRSIIREVRRLGVEPDGAAIHAYTRTPSAGQLNASFITNTARQHDPTVSECPGPLTWNDTWYSHFLIYRDYIGVMEAEGMRGKPVFITESGNACDPNPGNHCYPNQDIGYFQAMYQEADQWNKNPANVTKIRAITPYRWTRNDDGTGRDFEIGSRQGLLGDLQKAFAHRYAWTTPRCGVQPKCTKDGDCPQGQRCDLPSGDCRTPPCQDDAACSGGLCSPSNCETAANQCIGKGQGSFSWDTQPPQPDQTLRVHFTHPEGWTFIGLRYCGAAKGEGRDLQITRNAQGHPIWSYTIGPLPAGRYRLDFTAENGSRIIGSTALLVPAPCSPKPEECNNQDDDCDGQIDEGLTRSCFDADPAALQYPPCKEGIQRCLGGQWSACDGQIIPSAEICDGVDNDCNGSIDEGCHESHPVEMPVEQAPERPRTEGSIEGILHLDGSPKHPEKTTLRPQGCGCHTETLDISLWFFLALILLGLQRRA
jgi:hypothetical protein